jgi:hypothetical protein
VHQGGGLGHRDHDNILLFLLCRNSRAPEAGGTKVS